MVRAHSTSQRVPGAWTNKTDNLFADGIGRRDGSEVIVMESSGSYAKEDIDHSVGDTMKLIKMATSSLRSGILKYPNASIETAKGLAVFGVQCICDKITLTKYSLHDSRKWEVLELRSATILVTWNSRFSLVHVFELLATLQVSSLKVKIIDDCVN